MAWPVRAANIPYLPAEPQPRETANSNSIPIWQGYILPKTILTYVPLNLEPTNFDPNSCISFVKAVLGVKGTLGNANDLVPNTDEPSIGAIVLTNEGRGHAGIVIDLTPEFITIKESNYIAGEVTTRTLPRNYERIRGYFIHKFY